MKSTGTKVAVRDGDIFGLEHDLHNAFQMAHIASSLMEHNLSSKEHQEITGKSNTYYLHAETVDAMLYAVYETQNQIRRLRDRYLRALES